MGRWARRFVEQFYTRLAWAYDPAVWLIGGGTVEIPDELFPIRRAGLVHVGSTRVVVHILGKGQSPFSH